MKKYLLILTNSYSKLKILKIAIENLSFVEIVEIIVNQLKNLKHDP